MNLASLLARAQRTLDALHRRRRSHPPGVEAPPAGVCERPTGGRHTYRARDGGVGAGVSAAVIARARVGGLESPGTPAVRLHAARCGVGR